MPDKGMNRVVQHLFEVARGRSGGELTDGQMLISFLAKREDAVFEAMVHRHGPMVLAVCRRVLGHAQDAEDAFQGAFLVLLRKAGGIHPREKVATWLYGVACRVALKAREARQRRQAREKPLSAIPEPQSSEENRDWLPLLDRELQALPAKYRLPIILCDLEGKSERQAAGQLGWREGTLSGRLSRARALLCRRLSQRGFSLSVAGLVAGVSAQAASAKVPAALAAATTKAGSFVAIKEAAAAGAISAQAVLLAEGVINAMFVSNLKTVLVSLALVIVATGLGGALYTAWGQGEGRAPEGKGIAPKVVRVEAPSEKEKEFVKKLQTPGNFSYHNQELRTILNNLSEAKEINIVIDPSAMIVPPEGGGHVDQPVSLELRDVPLETAIRHLVEAGNLGYLKQDGILVVTSKAKSLVRKVYFVGGLVGDNEERNVPAVITAIIRTVEPGTWWFPPNPKLFNLFQDGAAQPKAAAGPMGNDSGPILPPGDGGPADLLGGAGTIAYFPATKALVVRHYPGVHREIEDLLVKLAEK